MSRFFFHQELTVLRPGTREQRDGSTALDWSEGAVTQHTLPSVNVQSAAPRLAISDTAESTTEGLTVYGPEGATLDVRAGDHLLHQGKRYRLTDEEIRTEYDPITGRLHHQWFSLESWEGGPGRGL